MLALDHVHGVVPEDHLVVDAILRLQHIDGLVGIDGAEAALGQLGSHAGTQNRGTVHTQDGIHRGIVDKMGNQLTGAVLGLTETGLLISNINVVVDVGVVGGKMALGHPQRCFTLSNGQVHQCDHTVSLLKEIKKKTSSAPAAAFWPDP